MCLIFVLVLILFGVDAEVYPCSIAKCANELSCRAVESNCIRQPCPLIARCLNESSTAFDPCPFGKSILQRNGRQFYCGRGVNSRICPRFTRCIADPTDKFAVCCWSKHPEYDYQDKPSTDALTYDGICPLIPPPFSVGACIDRCSSDSQCLDGMKCCNTGCGHMCLEAEIPRPKFACPVPTRNPFGLCVDVCTFESDCKSHERCCSNGCGQVCMSAQDVSLAMTSFKTKASIRPGYCPAEKSIRYIECSDREQCTVDSDCFGIRKCCFNEQCGYICLNPRKRQIYVDKWLYEWKNKWYL